MTPDQAAKLDRILQIAEAIDRPINGAPDMAGAYLARTWQIAEALDVNINGGGTLAGIREAVAQLAGMVAGLKVASTGEADLDKIAAAAKAGAEEALVASQGPLAAAVEDLTSALDQLDPGEITQAVSEAMARLRVIVAPAEEATHG